MPSARVASDSHARRPADGWRTAGLALLAIWSTFFAAAVALWLRLVLFPGEGADPHGYIRMIGAPFALVALGLLWWAWWSARALQRGRREGWTLLLVLGGVAVAQAVMTAPGVVAASTGSGTPGATQTSGAPRELVGGMLGAIVLGLVTVTVAVLARRSWAAADPADPAADGVSDPG